MLKKVLGAAFKKPGARTRLGQVLPIVRLMTPPQRLALASLVMAQVLAGKSVTSRGKYYLVFIYYANEMIIKFMDL